MIKLGEKHNDCDPGFRDAVHVQCVVVKCDDTLEPGQSVRFTDRDYDWVTPTEDDNRQAIVDPFGDTVYAGDKALVLLKPGLTSDPIHHFDIEDEEDPDPDGIGCGTYCG
jgi:hypothetical protein